MKGKIILETGEIVESCQFFSSDEKTFGKLIFDTRVVGYEKILTCPEYKDKIVVFSYPLIGNYGINYEDLETKNIYPRGIVISESSSVFSNFRANSSLADFLSTAKVSVAIGADTQYLTRAISKNKKMWAAVVPFDITTEGIAEEILAKKEMEEKQLPNPGIEKCETCRSDAEKPYIAVLNLGLKNSEISNLGYSKYRINILTPDSSGIEDAFASSKAIYITSGTENPCTIKKCARLIEKQIGRVPVFGTGLGHLIIGTAVGGRISETVVNHYGINHPVLDIETKNCIITEQAHSLTLETAGISEDKIKYVHLNDKTLEGLYDGRMKTASVSFNPQKEHFQSFFSMIKD